MPSAPSPLGRLVDVAFFAPIGLVCRLREQVPQLAGAGRERLEGQVRLARMIGKLAVTQGRRELNRRLDEIAEQRRLAAEGPIIERVPTPNATKATTGALTRVATPVATGARARVATEPTRADGSPRTAATTATAAASKRSSPDGQLQAVTVPSGPTPDAAALAISDYDSLAASQVVARLDALGPAELAAIGRYEAAKRGRRTILGKVQQLQAR